MRDMTHSCMYVWHNSFMCICVTWPIHVRYFDYANTIWLNIFCRSHLCTPHANSYVPPDVFIWYLFVCDSWLLYMFCIPHLCTHHANWYVSTTYAYATYLYVTHDRFICVLYSVFVYTHPAKSCLSREVFICDAWLIHMCFTGRTCVSSTQIRKTWRGVCE